MPFVTALPPFGNPHPACAGLKGLHGGVRRIKKSLHGFFEDCRIARQFCMLLTRHPWLDTAWQERYKNPSVDFLGYWRTAMQFSKLLSRASMRSLLFGKYDKNSMDFFMIAELHGSSACCYPAIHGLILLGKNELKIPPWIF